MKPTNLVKGWVNTSIALACLFGGTTIVATVATAQNGPTVQTSDFPSPSEAREEDYRWEPDWKWSENHKYHFDWCYRKYSTDQYGSKKYEHFTDEHGRKYYVCYPEKPYQDTTGSGV